MNQDSFKDLVRLNDAQLETLLEQMDRASRVGDPTLQAELDNKRREKRREFRATNVELTVEHPAGGFSRVLVCARNISSGGMSFIHGGFLYIGSKCTISISTTHDSPVSATGEVVRCRHIERSLHEIGLKFEHPIEGHCLPNSGESAMAGPADTVDLSELCGRVLYIEDNPLDHKLLAHHLSQTGVELLAVTTSGAAMDAIKNKRPDIILTDLNLEEHNGIELIRKIREAEFNGPLAAITADDDQSQIEKAHAAGANEVLQKPYPTEELFACLSRLHQEAGTVVSDNGLCSTMDSDPNMAELITSYIDNVQIVSRRLEQSISEENIDIAKKLCLHVKGSAENFGFGLLGDAANEALTTINAAGTIQNSLPQLRKLILMCNSLRKRPNSDEK